MIHQTLMPATIALPDSVAAPAPQSTDAATLSGNAIVADIVLNNTLNIDSKFANVVLVDGTGTVAEFDATRGRVATRKVDGGYYVTVDAEYCHATVGGVQTEHDDGISYFYIQTAGTVEATIHGDDVVMGFN